MNQNEQLEALLALKEGFSVDGREYRFTPMPFKVGRKILAYMTTVGDQIERGELGFIDTPKFENEIEPLLLKYTTVDGFKLDTEGMLNHFDEHPSDYFQFVINAIQGYAAPFLPGKSMSSNSTYKEPQTTTLKKPM
ncbi:hypothetical protein [Vibrio phage XM1]|nr:hypothetical protein [Vibrio phage XM1]